MPRVAALFLVACFHCLLAVVRGQDPSAAPSAPDYPSDFVGGAEITTTNGTQAAGAASVVKLADGFQAYVVSARHLLGPAGGFDKEVAAADVPKTVKSIKIEAFKGGTRSYSVTPLLVPATQLEPIGAGPINDMVIYQLNDTSPQDQAVELADKLPATGETVYLIAHVAGGVPESQRVHTLKVVDTRQWLEGVFDNDKIVTAGASGAPVLNGAGKCIGVYSGHSVVDGHVHGFIIPSPLLIATIKSAPVAAGP